MKSYSQILNFWTLYAENLFLFLQLYSDIAYKEEYEKEVKGKHAAKDMESYPEYVHAIKTGKIASQVMVNL